MRGNRGVASWSLSWRTTSHKSNSSARLGSLGARLRGPLRPLPVGRRAGRAARSPPGAAQPRARVHGGDRQRHRPEPAALPRRPRRAGPASNRTPRCAPASRRGCAAAAGGRGWSTRRRSGCRSPTDRSTRSSRPSCCAPSTLPISPCGRSCGCCGPTVSCSSSSTSAPSRRRSPAGRTASPGRGVASREAVAATARPRS